MADTVDTSELRLRERELKLKEDELAHRRAMDARSSRFQLSPWTTALIALLTTGITASVSGLWSQRADAARGRREIALREREQQFQIVLKATENRTPEVAARNLLFFVDIGYLPDPDSAIRKKAAAGEVPVITSPGGRPDNPIEERIQQAQSLAAPPAVTVPGVPLTLRSHVLFTADGKPVSVIRTPSVGRMREQRLVVLHSTGTSTAAQATRILTDSTWRASSHVVVDRDGSIIQMAPFDFAAWHVGRGNWKGRDSLNYYSVGIELVNRGQLKRKGNQWVDQYSEVPIPAREVVVIRSNTGEQVGWHAYTDVQIRTVVALIRLLRAGYPSISEVVGHGQVSPNRDFDPGPALPLERIRSQAGVPAR